MLKATVRGSLAAALACGLLALLAAPRADAAPAWLAPVSISEAGQEAGGPQVAFDSHGDAVAVWDSAAGTGKYGLTTHVVQAAFRPAGGSWQASVSVGWCNEGSCEPQVGIDTRGDAVALWQAYTGFTFVVESSYKPAGGVWRAPVLLSPAEIPGAAHPKLAVDQQGDAIAIWNRGGPAGGAVQEAFKPAGGAWESPVEVAEIGDNPQVAFDGRGDALALSSRIGRRNKEGQYEWELLSSYMPASGAWQAPVEVSAPGLVVEPSMVVNDQGAAALVWDQWTNGFLSHRVVQAAFRTAGSEWQTPVDLSEEHHGEDWRWEPYEPRVAIDEQGDAVVVWSQGEDGVLSAFKPSGGAWQAPVDVSAPDPSDSDAQVAFDAQGNALAVWDDGDDTVQSAFKPAGGEWQAPVDIGHGGGPEIAFDGQGDAVAAWTGQSAIEAAGYVATGPALDGLSIPTTGVAGQPVTFSVAPLDVWSVLGETTWGFGDGASAIGASVTHTYTAAGLYEVTLRSADTLGNVTTSAGEITIAPAPPTPRPTPVTPTAAALVSPPTTPTGSIGPAGPAPKNGEVQLVTCKSALTGTAKNKKTTQMCTIELTSSQVTTTTDGASIAAVLSRGKVLYATGSAIVSGKHTKLLLIPRQRIGKGSYTLTLTHGPERQHERITID